MELPGSLLIWNRLSVEGFFEGHPHIVPKIAPVLRELVQMSARRHSPADYRDLSH